MSDATERIVPRSSEAVIEPPSAATDDARARRPESPKRMQVRAADLEPYVGLKYLSRLFKLMAIILILVLASEVITGLVSYGISDFPSLLGEISRLIVLAGLLWGSGDLAILLIDMGHDLRATRILLGRQLAHSMDEQHARIDPGMTHETAESDQLV